jgi:hypothetical protein
MAKGKIVLVPFPFDDYRLPKFGQQLRSNHINPAICD